MPDAASSVSDSRGVLAKQPSCSVLVMSCDAYRDLWTPFFTLFWRYWPDCPFRVYLGSNSAVFDDPRITSLTAGNYEWSKRLRLNLGQIQTDYVLLLLDDYFFVQPVATGEINEALSLLGRLGGTVLRLYPLPGPDEPVEGCESIGEIHALASYRVSTQASIWRRSNLSKLLKDDETIWDFERSGSRRSRDAPEGFYSMYKNLLPYRQAVERGEWFRSAAAFFAKQRIGCDFTARAVMGRATALRKSVTRRSKNLLDRVLPPQLRFRI